MTRTKRKINLPACPAVKRKMSVLHFSGEPPSVVGQVVQANFKRHHVAVHSG